MVMTVFKSNGIMQPITKINLYTWYIFCGNYRKFEVDAKNKQDAILRFSIIKPAGFTKQNITGVERKK